jgi:uncharacterized protein (TIGR03435 family)
MLQTLLTDRFKLAVHRETREIPVYALTVAEGGPKLKQSTEASCFDFDPAVPMQGSACGASLMQLAAPDQATVQTFRTSLDEFSKLLVFALDRPVVNKTGINGAFDISMAFAPVGGVLQSTPVGGGIAVTGPVAARATLPLSDTSIFTAIQEQLGLQLQPGKAPVEFLAVDRVERPSEN